MKEHGLPFRQAVSVLPAELAEPLLRLPPTQTVGVNEIRLRSGAPLMLTCRDGPRFVCGNTLQPTVIGNPLSVSNAVLAKAFEHICGYSVHAHQAEIREGFITLKGGHRVGIGGTAVYQGDSVAAVKHIGFLDIRIARQVKGAADGIYNVLFSDGCPSLLIAGPPASGKTTVLRDLARQLAGAQRGRFLPTVLCDERGELAAVWEGKPTHDVGENCDVLTGYRKCDGIMTALRCLAPRVIICDEIGTEREVAAAEQGLNAGVAFIASVHAASQGELKTRLPVQRLLATGAFSHAVLLGSRYGEFEIVSAKEIYHADAFGFASFGGGGYGRAVAAEQTQAAPSHNGAASGFGSGDRSITTLHLPARNGTDADPFAGEPF